MLLAINDLHLSILPDCLGIKKHLYLRSLTDEIHKKHLNNG